MSSRSVRRPLDPKKCNIALDANALDAAEVNSAARVERFKALMNAHEITVVIPGGVRSEIQHVNTPAPVQTAILPQIFNLSPERNSSGRVNHGEVETILQGNAHGGKHVADASHLCEAAETGCAYFVTHDRRILGKRHKLADALPPSLFIVTLEEFFNEFDGYTKQDAEE